MSTHFRLAAWLLCAWVLWGEYGDLIDGDLRMREPRPQGAFATSAECSTAMAGYIAGIARSATAVGRQGDSWITWVHLSEGKGATFRCLPDTVDPRGPKR
jgi:hypothetical protein